MLRILLRENNGINFRGSKRDGGIFQVMPVQLTKSLMFISSSIGIERDSGELRNTQQLGVETLFSTLFGPVLRIMESKQIRHYHIRAVGHAMNNSFSSGIALPSPCSFGEWAHTESQKEVYGSSSRHSTFQTNERANNGRDIFISKESYKLWSTWEVVFKPTIL